MPDAADAAAVYVFQQLANRRMIEEHVADEERYACCLRGVYDLLCIPDAQRKRLLNEDVFTCSDRSQRERCVRGRGRCDDDTVKPRVLKHGVAIDEDLHLRVMRADLFETVQIRVANCRQDAHLAAVAHEICAPIPGADDADAGTLFHKSTTFWRAAPSTFFVAFRVSMTTLACSATLA